MSQPVLEIESLSKRYRIGGGGTRAPYRTVRESLTSAVASPLRALRRGANDRADRTLWALKDVTFSVAAGEAVGVIGRNGAGKSTLLKILAGITEPTRGRALVRGRVASLLEVGAGFHPELNGRENVYLSGAILGMTRAEIRRKFDEIVAFAEVEKFIDTPVKRYSSGMYMRLAFAVAAHLEPEILLVDEVLAVGDTEFQKKCLGKMEHVAAAEGRAVLFVSHNLHAVASMCQSAICLHHGAVVEHGPTREVVERYLASDAHGGGERRWTPSEAPGDELVRLDAVRVLGGDGEISADVYTSEAFSLEMEFCCHRATKVTPNFHIYNSHGLLLFTTANLHDPEWGGATYEPGRYRSACTVPASLLNEGQYHASAFLSRDTDGRAHVHVPMALSFQVTDDGSARGAYLGVWPGLIRPLLPWRGRRIEEPCEATGAACL